MQYLSADNILGKSKSGYRIRPVRILHRSTPVVMMSPAVAMAAGVRGQRPPAGAQLPWQPPGST